MSIPQRSLGGAKIRGKYSFAARNLVQKTQRFIHTESLSGVVLLIAACIAMIWANSGWKDAYQHLWHTPIQVNFGSFAIKENLHHIVNDVFMAIFFFVVGMEIKRELAYGSLSSPKKAALPIIAALGGMITPAAIYLAFNHGGQATSGWGIPVATDIAFSLGILSLLGRRIPVEARIFLLALAIADDIGGILVIALYYTSHLSPIALSLAGIIICVIYFMKRLQVIVIWPYLLLGCFLWLAVFESGIHATISGVILGLMMPAYPAWKREDADEELAKAVDAYQKAAKSGDVQKAENSLGQIEEIVRNTESLLDRLVRTLHPWSNFFILPIFALANSGVEISPDIAKIALQSPITLGVALGLVFGKFTGILGTSWVASKLKLVEIPKSVTWNHIAGMSLVAGIGFTVSLFITGLAFKDELFTSEAKIGIIIGSLTAGVLGYLYLRLFLKEPKAT